ncbi:MAG TPA: putative porin [Cytophagaceae bacterium]
MLKKLFLVLISLAGIVFSGYSQILDDTTQLLYGPKSTRYVLEDDVLNMVDTTYAVDTLINGIHEYDFLYENDILYQNLGNYATPLSPIFYVPPGTIGRTLGVTVFDRYAYDPSGIRYYDTKSPFTSLSYLQGSKGQQMLRAIFSRNVNPYWNFGGDLRRITSQKQIGFPQPRENQASHWAFSFYTRYFSANGKYQIMANFSHLHHTINETGGVLPPSGEETTDDLFDFQLEPVRLFNARSLEKRYNYHLFQELALDSTRNFYLFDIVDIQKRVNRYDDKDLASDTAFIPYQITLFDQNATQDRMDYRLFQNIAGIKGVIGKMFARVYFRNRYYTLEHSYAPEATRAYYDYFVGGAARYTISPTSMARVNGEFMLGEDYLIRGEYLNKAFQLLYYRVNSSPTLVQRMYIGNNFGWYNPQFVNTLSDNLQVNARVRFGNFSIGPFVNLANIQNYIYYDASAIPQQTNEAIQYISAGSSLIYRYKSLNFENIVRFSSVSGPDVLRVPPVFNHFRFYIQNKILKNALHAQLGLDLYYRSTYFANNYMPVTQQFYLNNTFETQQYLLGDLFLNMEVKSALIFLRLSHFNEGLLERGYFVTPYYPGLMRTFEFGITWRFYD